ncbi:MAG: hypothetical protein COW71_05135 [Ignavibacteriales bacterium CG18_big_fil_WC_8_21_14_2_50_31_20]|nr:MAG: hypothetical protein COW71_05135 [Ignavibacteriales bacterium CG18_big_fil_WC_8_21_14_2_50_31_20]
MQKYLVMFAFTILLSASLIAKDVTKYGKEITAKEKVKVSEILEKPENYVGKKVLVEGTVLNVCEKRGCWIELASDKEFESIRVKVNDGEIVFPMEAKGQKALVEGELYSFTVEVGEKECSGKDCKDEAKEKKEDCKSEKKHVKTVYQIQGIGAEI